MLNSKRSEIRLVTGNRVEQDDVEKEVDRRVADRRASAASAWSDPRFIVGTVIQVLLMLSAIGGFYLMSERRTTTLEVALTNFNDKASKIEGQLNTISGSMQSVTVAMGKRESENEFLKREIQDLKQSNGELKAHIDVLKADVAYLKAKTSNK